VGLAKTKGPPSLLPMTEDERLLLENVLDAFDRLNDGETHVVDLHALLVATAAALPGSPLAPEMKSVALALLSLVRQSKSKGEQVGEALDAVQSLRERVASALPS
jgi:hypothetical protein